MTTQVASQGVTPQRARPIRMNTKHNIHLLSRLGVGALLVSVGCCQHCLQKRDFPIGAIPAPLGTYSSEWQQAHAAAAQEDGYVLFLADWIGDTTRLGPDAKKRLTRLSEHGGTPTHQLLIQESQDSDLDQRRRSAVTEFMAAHGMAYPTESVVVGEPDSLGLYDSSRVLGETKGAGGLSNPLGSAGLMNSF